MCFVTVSIASSRLSHLREQVYNITNDEPIQFWVFIAVLMSKFDMDAPHIHLPYWLLYGVAWFLERVVRLLIPAYQPFLSPFKVALAGTHHYYSCEKAKRDLGFRPVVSLADGIDDAVHYFKSLENTK